MSIMIELSPGLDMVGLTPGSSADSYASSPDAMPSQYYSHMEPEVTIAEQDQSMYYNPDLYYQYGSHSQQQAGIYTSNDDQCVSYDPWRTMQFDSTPGPDLFPYAPNANQELASATNTHLNHYSMGTDQYLAPPLTRAQSHAIVPTTAYMTSNLPYHSINRQQRPSISSVSTRSHQSTSTSSTFNSPRNSSSLPANTNTSTTTTPPFSNLPSNMTPYGIPLTPTGPWRCAYPSCTSDALFTRGCDLRKHYNRHSKHLFCRVDGCPQSESAALAATTVDESQNTAGVIKSTLPPIRSIGFSSKKDRARHEAKHNPSVRCEWSDRTDEFGNPRQQDENANRRRNRGADDEWEDDEWDSIVGRNRRGLEQQQQEPEGRCGRVFSRVDNMKDHVRRVHKKGSMSTR